METRQFAVHPSILFSIIKSQAGTLSKALLEAVMNAIDAGGTRCSIKLDNQQFTVKDDGKGFKSRTEVEQFFETFGTPHEEGDAIYGRFRMGRGQLFAFARNTWRTGTFQMEVDIQAKGLDYGLKTNLSPVKGCTIQGKLYEAMPDWQLQETLGELKKLLMFAQIPVTLNGAVISKQPSSMKWDLETPDAYIKLTSSNVLSVYNLGVLVRDYGTYNIGAGGIVVSKVPLAVNFARNDILTHSCNVWRRVREVIRAKAATKLARKTSLSEDERIFVANQFIGGTDPYEYDTWTQFGKANMVLTAAGRNSSLQQLLEADTITLVPEARKRMGERLHRSRQAFCVTEETLRRFNCETLEEFVRAIRARAPTYIHTPRVVDFETFAKQANPGYVTVDESRYEPAESLAMSVLENVNRRFLGQWLKNVSEPIEVRALFLGESDSALAWTDGQSTVHVERRFLLRCARKGLNGWHQLMMVMLHEYCHGDQDLESHVHDQNFYELFEELATDSGCSIAEAAVAATQEFNAKAQARGISLSQRVQREGERCKVAGRTERRSVAQSVAASDSGEGQLALFA